MEIREQLDTEVVSEVVDLVALGARADGLAALGEQTVLNLRHGSDTPAVHVVIRRDTMLIGYANMELDGDVANVEMLVHPLYRHFGHGATMGRALLDEARSRGARRLHVWAHGDHPAAMALAERMDFGRERVLWQMRRRLRDDEPIVAPVPDVTIRSFVPGRDEQALLHVNAAAFADHPEQGGWTVRDVAMREREEWFDPAGLLLAERGSDGEVLGFHWTKVHGSGDSAIGEIYVLGVSPQAQGLKLGGALTVAGLKYLRGRGLNSVMLYVDESNERAVRLYSRAGFKRWTTDVNYQRELD